MPQLQTTGGLDYIRVGLDRLVERDMKIGIVLFDGCYGSSFTGLQDVLHIANYFSQSETRTSEQVFHTTLVGKNVKQVGLAGGGQIAASDTWTDCDPLDLIYIPSFPFFDEPTLERLIDDNGAMLYWLNKAWNAGATLAASCTATFLLAETGLLNRRRATTTWWLERQFRRRYPLVSLDRRAITTSDERLMCAGAMTSSLNLAIEIIAQRASASLASKVAKTMMIDTSRQVQPFLHGAVFGGGSNHPTVERARYWLQSHFGEKVEIPRLAAYLGVSSRSLNRYFKKDLGMSVIEYLQAIRVEHAKVLLEQTQLPISQIVEDIGYADVRSFTALFHRHVGMKLSDYKAWVAQSVSEAQASSCLEGARPFGKVI